MKWPRLSCRRSRSSWTLACRKLGSEWSRTLALQPQAFADATLRARQQLVALAQALELQVAPDSAAARLLPCPAPVVDVAASDELAPHELHPHATQPLTVQAPVSGPQAQAQMADDAVGRHPGCDQCHGQRGFALNDVLRMILERPCSVRWVRITSCLP